jgi:F-type H+-transporting ATPase subunit gamma
VSDGGAALRARIASAVDLRSMARTMKTIAASNIGQYETAARSLDLYYEVVQDSLAVCLRAARGTGPRPPARPAAGRACAIVFGSDQGLVGQFNEVICAAALAPRTAWQYDVVWAVGERAEAVLAERQAAIVHPLALPASIDAVTTLVGRLLIDIEASSTRDGVTRFDVYHHRPVAPSGSIPAYQCLLPLDREWQRSLLARPWPTPATPQVLPQGAATLRACIHEYLFVSLFRACTESLASENAARLSAMQRAEQNIEENLRGLTQTFHRQRQGAIDDELFDLVTGFEAQQAASGGQKRANTQN